MINKRLTGYIPGHQQYDYPAHTLQVLTGSRTVTLAPGAQTGRFSKETGVGRLDPHSYRPNEFFSNNWVYDGLVEYGPQGSIIPSLAESWTVTNIGAGQKYTFTLRQGVTFHDGEAWNCDAAKINFDHVLRGHTPVVWYAGRDRVLGVHRFSYFCDHDKQTLLPITAGTHVHPSTSNAITGYVQGWGLG